MPTRQTLTRLQQLEGAAGSACGQARTICQHTPVSRVLAIATMFERLARAYMSMARTLAKHAMHQPDFGTDATVQEIETARRLSGEYFDPAGVR